jgi:hypothetical protein
MKVKNLSNFELASLVIAGIVSVLLMVLMFSNPAFLKVGHIDIDQQGIYVPALIFGGILWGIIELFSKPTGSHIRAVVNALCGFLLGLIIGGLLGYTLNFGQYVLIPAYYGNIGAILFLLGLLFGAVVVLFDASWFHTKRIVA